MDSLLSRAKTILAFKHPVLWNCVFLSFSRPDKMPRSIHVLNRMCVYFIMKMSTSDRHSVCASSFPYIIHSHMYRGHRYLFDVERDNRIGGTKMTHAFLFNTDWVCPVRRARGHLHWDRRMFGLIYRRRLLAPFASLLRVSRRPDFNSPLWVKHPRRARPFVIVSPF